MKTPRVSIRRLAMNPSRARGLVRLTCNSADSMVRPYLVRYLHNGMYIDGCFGVFVGKQLVGWSCLLFMIDYNPIRMVPMLNVFISKEHRRKGFASKLCTKSLGWLSRMGHEGVVTASVAHYKPYPDLIAAAGFKFKAWPVKI